MIKLQVDPTTSDTVTVIEPYYTAIDYGNSLASGIIGDQRFPVLYPLKTQGMPFEPEVKGGYPRRGLFAWTAAARRIAWGHPGTGAVPAGPRNASGAGV